MADPLPPAACPPIGVASIAGVPVHALSRDQAVHSILNAALERRALALHLCNAYVLSLASNDANYRNTLRGGNLNLADGAPVAWTLERLGLGLSGPRPSGPELFAEVLARSEGTSVTHFLHGAAPATVQRLTEVIASRWPRATVVGAESPPYRDLSEMEVRELGERISNSGASIVWIGTGTPRQDVLVERLRPHVDAVLAPVGAAFDFVAGTQRRAPDWMRRAGFEWIYRLAREPRRLWRRYLVGNAIFLLVSRRATVIRGRGRD